MSLVIDASITLAWFFEDEATQAADRVLRRVTDESAVVPSFWRFEVANVLQSAVRRRRADDAFRDRVLSHLARLAIVTDEASEIRAWSATVQLAQRHLLTVYDAAYLELAQRRRLPLATLDGR